MAYHHHLTTRFHLSPPSSPSTSVKVEPDDSDRRFIMELTAFPSDSPSSPSSLDEPFQQPPPPAQVPLRATQASKEMRLMMGVFRLNPFAMHSFHLNGDGESAKEHAMASPAGPWCSEVGPLEEEPIIFEFQLDIIGGIKQENEGEGEIGSKDDAPPAESEIPGFSAHEESQLRPFSPQFELHDGEEHPMPLEFKQQGEDHDRQTDAWDDINYAHSVANERLQRVVNQAVEAVHQPQPHHHHYHHHQYPALSVDLPSWNYASSFESTPGASIPTLESVALQGGGEERLIYGSASSEIVSF
jgi:hypothetical protein